MKKNNIKKIIYVLLILGLVLMATPSIRAQPAIDVSLSKYEPFPASPGQVIKVWVLVQNTGDSAANNIDIEVVPSYPFSLYGDSGKKSLSILGNNKDYIVDFNLKVDDNAIQGDNNLKIKTTFKTNNIDSVTEKNLDVYVQTRDATVTIDKINVVPDEIVPGSDGRVTITVKNTAPTTLTDLSMKLYLQANIGSTIVDLPFAPMDSSAEKKIYKLEADQTVDFTFNLRAYPDALSKIYKIPFVLSYYDSLGNQKNKSDYVGIIVNSPPDVVVLVDKTDLTTKKMSGKVNLKFVNKGLSDIKFLTIKLGKSDDFELLSTSDVNYIGNLASDDYQTAEYTISAKKNPVTIPVSIEYRDANNKIYQRTENVELNLIDSSKLKDAANSGGSFLIPGIIIIIIVAILIFFYVRNRAKNNKKGQF